MWTNSNNNNHPLTAETARRRVWGLQLAPWPYAEYQHKSTVHTRREQWHMSVCRSTYDDVPNLYPRCSDTGQKSEIFHTQSVTNTAAEDDPVPI